MILKQEKFLNQVKLIANTWLSYENKSTEEAVNGVIFSVLALIDGCSVDLLGFILAPITSRENQIIGGSLYDKYHCFK